MRELVVVGVDLGGTWVRAVVLGTDGRMLRSIRSPAPALAALAVFLESLWKRWGLSRSRVGMLVVGSRGVWTRAEQGRAARRLRALALRVRVISDAQAAYSGALGARPGVLILAGTGSIVIGRNEQGRWGRAGGLGPLLGDEGSAFWIGRQWLRATSQGEDFLPVRKIITGPDAVARIARLAPGVLRRARNGHPVARGIVAEAQRHLAGLAGNLAHDLRLKKPVAVSWAGRLLDDQHFRSGLHRQIKRSGLGIRMVPPETSPVMATARLALALLSRGERPDKAGCR